jgi:hypothetical protein
VRDWDWEAKGGENPKSRCGCRCLTPDALGPLVSQCLLNPTNPDFFLSFFRDNIQHPWIEKKSFRKWAFIT